MTLNFQETQPETLADWVKRLNLTMTAQNIDARPDRDDAQWSDKAIHFNVTVRSTAMVIWSGCYTVGSSYPEMWARKKQRDCDAAGIKPPGAFVKVDLRKLANEHPNSVYAAGIREKITASYKKAAPIALVDVLDSLRSDAMGADQSFDDWADDYGLDTDSRKALAIYEQCRDVLNSFKRSLGADFESLMECEPL